MVTRNETILVRAVALCLAVVALGAVATSAPVWAAAQQGSASKELVAVLDMDAVGATAPQAAALTDRLREVLLNSGRYTLVDRSQMKAILNEQAFQETGCTSRECAVKAGQVLGVRKIVSSRIIKAEAHLWLVSAMIIDVESAQTLAAQSVQYQGSFAGLLSKGIADLGAKLTGEAAPTKLATMSPPQAAPPLVKPVESPRAKALTAASQCYKDVGSRYGVLYGVGYILSVTPGLSTLTSMQKDRSDCSRKYDVSGREVDQYFFVSTNQSHIVQEMSQGQGSYLKSLAGMLGCGSGKFPQFARLAQTHFRELSASADVSPAQLLVTLKSEMNRQPALAVCLRTT